MSKLTTIYLIMANAAQILRTLVAQTFNIDPKTVYLSGNIALDYDLNKGNSYSSSAGSRFDLYKLWGFSSERGFEQIKTYNSWSTGSGERCELEPETLASYLESKNQQEDYTFFVEFSEENAGSWNGAETTEQWVLYSTPDFKAYIQSLNDADIQRWENWIK